MKNLIHNNLIYKIGDLKMVIIVINIIFMATNLAIVTYESSFKIFYSEHKFNVYKWLRLSLVIAVVFFVSLSGTNNVSMASTASLNTHGDIVLHEHSAHSEEGHEQLHHNSDVDCDKCTSEACSLKCPNVCYSQVLYLPIFSVIFDQKLEQKYLNWIYKSMVSLAATVEKRPPR